MAPAADLRRPPPAPTLATRINAAIDGRWSPATAAQAPRDYLGGSRLGEPCCAQAGLRATSPRRRTRAATSRPRRCGSSTPAIAFEDTRRSAGCALAGFDLRDRARRRAAVRLLAADGRFRATSTACIVAGPDVGVAWPALWEHKALNAAVLDRRREARRSRCRSRSTTRRSQLYMAYMELRGRRCSPRSTRTPGAPPRARAVRPGRRPDAVRQGRRGDPRRPRPASCCRGSRAQPRLLPSAAGAACAGRTLLGSGGMTTSPRRPRRPRAIREIKDWFENRTARAAGVPAVRLCRHRKEHDHRATPSTSSASTPHQSERDGGCGAACVYRDLHRQGGAGDDPQGHAGLDHPQPDLPRARGDREEIAARSRRRCASCEAGIRTPGRRRAHRRRGAASRRCGMRLRRHAQAALRAQRADRLRARRRAHRARRGLDGRRRRWRATCWPSASRSWCWAIPASCRRSRAKAPSPATRPT